MLMPHVPGFSANGFTLLNKLGSSYRMGSSASSSFCRDVQLFAATGAFLFVSSYLFVLKWGVKIPFHVRSTEARSACYLGCIGDI